MVQSWANFVSWNCATSLSVWMWCLTVVLIHLLDKANRVSKQIAVNCSLFYWCRAQWSSLQHFSSLWRILRCEPNFFKMLVPVSLALSHNLGLRLWTSSHSPNLNSSFKMLIASISCSILTKSSYRRRRSKSPVPFRIIFRLLQLFKSHLQCGDNIIHVFQIDVPTVWSHFSGMKLWLEKCSTSFCTAPTFVALENRNSFFS